MQLRYKSLINSQKLTITCPPENYKLNDEIEAVRWVINPIEDDLNFLPNHLYDLKRGAQVRAMPENIKCGYCSLSFHTSIDASTVAFHSLSSNLQQKLGYTHIAHGTIEKGTGLMSEPHPISKHFELFEIKEIVWMNNFVITNSL
jgi:hypothetical protein